MIQVGFNGVKGNGFDSDIAVDDISISPGSCNVPEKDNGNPFILFLTQWIVGESYYKCLENKNLIIFVVIHNVKLLGSYLDNAKYYANG